MTSTAFEHPALDPANPRAFQILELLPSHNLKGPIRCELRHCSLEEDVRYEAVSYTWGDPSPGYTVYVNGPHTLEVTQNCLEALRSFRRRFRRRRLWIDAICIDQQETGTSKKERDRQVRMMGDIYRKAKRVLVWLGPEEPSSARTITQLKLIAMVNAIRRSMCSKSSALFALERQLSGRTNSVNTTLQPRYQAFASMVHSPWWYRVWTLQEQVLARECQVYHGRRSISMSALQANQRAAFLQFMHDEDGRFENGIRHRIHKFRQLYDASPPLAADRKALQPLIEYTAKKLLDLAFLLEAKHPIDKIYGIYGILTAYCNLPLSAPDYDSTAENVFEETVLAWITTRRDLSILKLAARPGIIDNLPSWVPAWNQQHPKLERNNGRPAVEDSSNRQLSHFNWNYYCDVAREVPSDSPTDTQTPASVALVIAPGKLRVLHTRFAGKVSKARPDRTQGCKWHQVSIESLYVHLDWCRYICDVTLYHPTEREEASFEVFRSILHPGIHQSNFKDGQSLAALFQSFRSWFDFVSYLNESGGYTISDSLGEADADHHRNLAAKTYYDVCAADGEEEATDVLENVYSGGVQGRQNLNKIAQGVRSTEKALRVMRNHSLCILDNDNMIAITDYWCQEGDEVFVLPGTDSPFILRRVPHEECYRLVGPALVDRLFRVGYQNWRSEGPDLQDIVLI